MKPGKGQVTARNQRYKLYQSGEFYDVPNDLQEQHPLADSSLSPEHGRSCLLRELTDRAS